MMVLNKISKLDKTRRFVFFSELFAVDQVDDFLKYIAYLPEKATSEFLETFHRHEQVQMKEGIEKLGEISKEDAEKAAVNLEKILDRMDELMEKQKKIKEYAEKQIVVNRDFMKEWLTRDHPVSDQAMGMPCPPLQKPVAEGADIFDLPEPKPETLIHNDLFKAIKDRQSMRKFDQKNLTLDELSYLLWSTQGIKKVLANGKVSIRTVPSGGARHPFETYIGINWVDGLKPGMYRYLPVDHKLEFLFEDKDMIKNLTEAGVGQRFVGECAACFIWSCIPYRGEWRYSIASHKVMLLDVGHVCQNLYLACEAIECGTCAIGAYSQEIIDKYLKLDGKDEFVVYLSPVGKVS